MKNRKILFRIAVIVITAAIGQAAFAQSPESDFETKENDDGSVTITKYVGWDSVVKIPDTIGGKPVTAIGKQAFYKQDNLTSVTIPDSVVSIGESAFETNKLTGVTFGKGLMHIGERAFYDNKLTSVTFGKGLLSIGDRAFCDNNLSSITLPDTVYYIGERAFSHNLLAKITLTGTCTEIDSYAFARNKQLTSITLGSYFTFDSTSFIEEDDKYYLRKWNTEDKGKRGRNLFWDYVCNDMKAGTYTPDLKYRAPKKDGDFDYIATRCGAVIVKYNGEPTSIRIPEKIGGLAVKHIGSNTFNDKKVERVLIPNGVTSIGDNAFHNKNLTSLVIPDSVVYIGIAAFYGEYYHTLTNLTLGNGVKVIGGSAFRRQELTSLVIPDSVVSIGNAAFAANKLTNLVIPDSVVYIRYKAFYDCRELTTVSISPVEGRYWWEDVFSNCRVDSESQAALREAGYNGEF